MARQIITKLLDDLSGEEADESVSFAMDGVEYTIDLSSKNAAEFRRLMEKYQDAGTRVGRVGTHAQVRSYAAGRTTPTTAVNKELNHRIRVWAAENGYTLNDRGRIPQHIVDAYTAKTPNPAARLPLASNNEAAERLAAELATDSKPTKRTRARAS